MNTAGKVTSVLINCQPSNFAPTGQSTSRKSTSQYFLQAILKLLLTAGIVCVRITGVVGVPQWYAENCLKNYY
ncbi:MAG: hypothetical protein LBL39_05460 [Planctomycetaceae bacterium]|jgi:hypothetical protein|nr:hypothetical protein [Planctomycetaceae bacterium]